MIVALTVPLTALAVENGRLRRSSLNIGVLVLGVPMAIAFDVGLKILVTVPSNADPFDLPLLTSFIWVLVGMMNDILARIC